MDRSSPLPQHNKRMHSTPPRSSHTPSSSPLITFDSPTFSSSPAFPGTPRSMMSQYHTPSTPPHASTPGFTSSPDPSSFPSPGGSARSAGIFSHDGVRGAAGLGLGISSSSGSDDLSSREKPSSEPSFYKRRRSPFRFNIYTLALLNLLVLVYWRRSDQARLAVAAESFAASQLEARGSDEAPSQRISQQDLHDGSYGRRMKHKKLRKFGVVGSASSGMDEGEDSEDVTEEGSGSRSPNSSVASVPPSSHTSTCEVCLLHPEDPLCQYGLDNIHLSRAYMGSGHRVRQFLEKALRGEVVKIGILGGSVTAGHGLWDKPKWSQIFFQEFKKGFPKAEIYEGPAPAQGSAFFSFCYPALVPQDLDLYILELDINNEAIDRTYGEDDALFRSLLGLPHQPAVVRASVFALSFPNLALGTVSNLFMSQYFDVPIISIRNWLLPHSIVHPERAGELFGLLPDASSTDYRHIGWIAHQALGDMLTLYFREMACETRRRMDAPVVKPTSKWPGQEILGLVPRLYPWESFDAKKVAPPVKAQCMYGSSAFQPLVAMTDENYTTPGAWNREEWNGKVALASYEVGSRISFAFEGTRAGIYHWKTSGVRDGVKNKQMPGRAKCWIDDEEEKGIVIDAWFDEYASRSPWQMIGENLEFGHHRVVCQVLAESSTEGHDFRILGVASQ